MQKKTKESDIISFQVRLDSETHAKLKDIAECAEISMNQLVTGMLRGCAENVVQGEPYTSFGAVKSKDMKKCLFLGRTGTYSGLQYNEMREHFSEGEILEYYDMDKLPVKSDEGEYWFTIDYTGRGYVKHL